MKTYFLTVISAVLIFTSCGGEEPGTSIPDDNHFSKTALVTGELFEPIDMTILPNLDILIAQRRGGILKYDSERSELSLAGSLDVYHETGLENVNAEEGVVGIVKDPAFEENRFVYIYYSPADTSVNRLSRFRFGEDELDMESETIILELYSRRQICCHTGGGMDFDSNGLLYLATGDNSTPFNQPGEPYVLNGYAPLDGRPGFEQYDARRTAGNSNDLRGKILRIKVNEDGSYDIPKGNLYPEGMEKTRPEIYVQGTRNPYSVTLDSETGFLYWGDIGPDANEDSLGTRGPIGYDEINQAREAGHFGWPYFVGNNYAYNEYDYATGTPGQNFDPENPVNNSPSNTGLTELPPAQPAFIWYPYSESVQFPETGTGGRNAMAGLVYHTSEYPAETRLPDYFDNKLFIYDWVRNWIRVVTLSPEGDFERMEPFMENTEFSAIMDMEAGPDGKLYLLEYGSGWFKGNPDAGLTRIDYNSSPSVPSPDDEADKETEPGETPQGHQHPADELSGQELIATLDCSSCHLRSGNSVGPSYDSIAERYQNTDDAVPHLTESVIEGSTGIWGDRAMPPHAGLTEEDAEKMILWILSLSEGGE